MSPDLPLLPNQAWFLLEQRPALLNPHRWNMFRVLKLPTGVDSAMVRTAVDTVWLAHDALRATFADVRGTYRQRIGEQTVPPPLRTVDVSRLDVADQRRVIDRILEQAQATLNIEIGPLARFVHVVTAGTPARLIVVVHHLVCDSLSLSLLSSDIEATIGRLQLGKPVVPPRSAPYRECVLALADYAQSTALRDELAYWEAQPWDDVTRPPASARARPGESLSQWTSVTAVVGPGHGHLIAQARPSREGLDVEQVAVAAVADALTTWAGGPVCAQTVRHGRDLVWRAGGDSVLPRRAWRTVGWFATAGLVIVPPRGHRDPVCYARALVDRMGQAPNHGVGMGLLRWLTPPGAHSAAVQRMWARATVLLTYFGRVSGNWATELKRDRPPDEVIISGHDVLETHLPLHVRIAMSSDEFLVMLDHDRDALARSAITDLVTLVGDAFALSAEGLGHLAHAPVSPS